MADDKDVEDKESIARAQLPYKAEYCKTNRAKCKKCSEIMEANSVKLANMTKSRFHDGYDATFYHVPCFFQIKRPTSVAEIRHYESLKFEDQKMIEKAIETKGLSVLGTKVNAEINNNVKGDKKSSKDKKGKKRGTAESGLSESNILVNYDDFLTEYSKSSRAKCCSCEEKIEKSVVRIGKLDYDADTPYHAGPVPRWYHVDCFVKSLEKLEFFGIIEKVKGFDELEKDDQKMLIKTVKPIKPPEIDTKKIKTEKKSDEELKEEQLLKIQSERMFALREFVNTMKRKDLELMLESMNQRSNFKSPSMLTDMATDVLMFGPFKKCPVCNHSDGILLRGCTYICSKDLDDGTPCTYEAPNPKRGVPDIPDELVEKYPYLENDYKFYGGGRIFPTKFVKAVEQKEAENNNIVQESAPLDGLSIGIISWKSIKTDKNKVQKKIITLGGKIQTSLEKSLFVILSSKDELDKQSPKMEVAKELGVPFATEDFLFKIETKDDIIPQVEKCIIGDWKGDLKKRLTIDNTANSQ